MPRLNTQLPRMYSAPPGHSKAVSTELNKDLSSVGGRSAKLGQVIHHCFYKTGLIILESRLNVFGTSRPRESSKNNKWFNLEIVETELYAEQFKIWKNIELSPSRKIPPMVLHTYLDISDLSKNQTLSVSDGTHSHAINFNNMSTMKIVLERWIVNLDGEALSTPLELAVLYKKLVVLFRSLYTYTHLMPLWKLKSKIHKLRAHGTSLKVGCALSTDDVLSNDFLPISAPISSSLGSSIATFSFSPVGTPAGDFRISVQYRKNCHFEVHDSDALLSNQLLSADKHQLAASNNSQDFEDGKQYDQPPPSFATRLAKQSDPNSLLQSEIQHLASIESITAQAAPLVTIHPFKSPSLSASPGSNFDNMSISPKVAVNRYIHRGPSATSLNKFSMISDAASKSRAKLPPLTSGSLKLNTLDISNTPNLRRFSSSFGPRERKESFSSRNRLPLVNHPIRSIFKHNVSENPITDHSEHAVYDSEFASKDDLSGFIQLLDSHAHHLNASEGSKSSGSFPGKVQTLTSGISPVAHPHNSLGSSNEIFDIDTYNHSIDNSGSRFTEAVKHNLGNSSHSIMRHHTLGTLRSRPSFSEKSTFPAPLTSISQASTFQGDNRSPSTVIPHTQTEVPSANDTSKQLASLHDMRKSQSPICARSATSAGLPRFEYHTSLSKSLEHSSTPASLQATKTPSPSFVLEPGIPQEYKKHFDNLSEERRQCLTPSTPTYEYYNEHNPNYDDDLLFTMTDMTLEPHDVSAIRLGSPKSDD
ncbi:autophagy associated protein Atg13 [Schizosaccharomyces pombe]|uniref:Autophagy protein 13 n=1 Tax=Schizosaccharomyces pombe (strain 972 / ATCC 24843) TaxID=284812 RepID=ATG13_SCHPO|nr:autophagy-associated protein kinase regulatory subunit Atg13 [Schizosaccharomyces pombe]O36019.1 RecName: Full=Autophagy protein 13; AltName: Full=Meiotically up-regulated gene 78 protein [Schizosaccharomyces pombe 972h-]CAB11710.1 autophagy associated protein kinase regulatory subunit Atg13 [Schizosaccharomyces pombe]|eukprot:NP_594750.1 autophagy-associated protein kinase regulatory subunit Atg13 [Schizosaccharomyces pombe]